MREISNIEEIRIESNIDNDLLAQLVLTFNEPDATVENLLTFDETLATDCKLSNKNWEEELIENIIAEMSEPVITQELEIDE